MKMAAIIDPDCKIDFKELDLYPSILVKVGPNDNNYIHLFYIYIDLIKVITLFLDSKKMSYS